jgi:acyl-CoA hydrolase
MCVILEKIANQEVPYESIVAAAHRNPDGWGVTIPDGSSIEISRGLAKEPQAAADSVAKILQDHKSDLAYVHFRYKTVGDINVENTQPVSLLKRASGDACDMTFMHNGTLSDFKLKQGTSDSIVFAETIVEPLIRRSASYMGVERVLEDPLIASVLQHYSDMTSKFVLLDDAGNSLVINRTAGVEMPFGWASNKYSLDPANVERYKEAQERKNVHYMSQWSASKKNNLAFDVEQNKKYDYNNTDCCNPSIRMTVQEVTGLDLDDFEYLDSDQVRTLVAEEPDLAALLILDLIYDRSQSEYIINKAA